MIANVLRKVVGSSNARELKRMGRVVQRITALEPAMQALSDTELAAKTPEFKGRLAAGEKLNDILPEAFAAVREASRRFRDERPYDVQLVGGITLHEGKIAEMRTGEGKTLVATLPAYLNALAGGAVHIVTVNDYLARRDAAWMGPIYDALGMAVGVLQNEQDRDSKQAAYRADITYGTNSEFGFDYLRDNMVFTKEDRSQRTLDFAIVDEVDSILIDEARTPLIISGPAEASTDLYMKIDKLAPRLQAPGEDRTRSAGGACGQRTRTGGDRRFLRRREEPPGRTYRARPRVRREGTETARAARRERHALRGRQSRPAGTMSTPRSRPTSCSNATCTTWCRTAKWSSSTNTRVARFPVEPGATASTRPSRPRNACRSAARIRRSHPPRCRTTSACTGNWRG